MKTLYQKSKTGKIKLWSIQVEENGKSNYPEVVTTWGYQNMKMQTTREVVSAGVNEGRANQTSAIQQANLIMERTIREKLEDGYVESIEEQVKIEIDWQKPLPQSLVFYKPKNSIDENKIAKLESASSARFSVKRDGMMHVIRKSELAEIYTRRMDVTTERFPHLIDSLNKLPKGTILLGEMIKQTKDGQDDFKAVSSVCRSLTEEAVARQKNDIGWLTYYAFDIAFYNYENVLIAKTFNERRAILETLVKEIDSEFIVSSELINKTHSEALKEVISRRLEGLVVYDGEGVMQEADALTFTGKANRPNVVFKSKPIHETDVIVRFDPKNGIGDYGKGKNTGLVGNVFIYQLDKNNNESFICKCGGGLTEEQRKYYLDAEYPRVWSVEYDSVQTGTGSLRFPVFSRDRTLNADKEINECLLIDAIKNAREEEDEDE